MRSVLILVATVCFVCGPALGAPLILNPVKDTVIASYHAGQADEEANCNLGALSNQSRISKDVYRGAYDFATHQITSGVLHDWLVANGITPTGAAVKAAMDAGGLTVQFGAAQVGVQLNGASNEVRTIDCIVDWKEGNGTARYTNFAWTSLGGAATDWNPLQILPSEGTKKLRGWGVAGDKLFTEATYTKMSSADMVWGAVSDSYAYATLTSEGVRQLIDEPLNRGLYVSYTGVSSNGYSYTRENAAHAPQLVFTIVPEPATMCLLALGGLALLRRRNG